MKTWLIFFEVHFPQKFLTLTWNVCIYFCGCLRTFKEASCQPHIRHFPVSSRLHSLLFCPRVRLGGKLVLLISKLFHQEANLKRKKKRGRNGRKFTGKSVNAKYGNVYKLHETGRRTERCVWMWMWMSRGWRLKAAGWLPWLLAISRVGGQLVSGFAWRLLSSADAPKMNKISVTEYEAPHLRPASSSGGSSFGLPIL